MAYKRFVYKNGKKFGPYYYESFRDSDGKVQKRYVGSTDPDVSKKKGVVSTKRKRFVLIVSVLALKIVGTIRKLKLNLCKAKGERKGLFGFEKRVRKKKRI